MNLSNIRGQLTLVLKDHYAFDQFEYEDMFAGKVLKELDFDSIALLELFLVIEEAFDLNEKLSSRIDMKLAMNSSVEEFLDLVALEILRMFQDTQG